MSNFAHDGAVILYLLVAGVLTLILGAVALVLLQRAIVRNMMKTGGHAFMPPADDRPRLAAGAQLIFDEHIGCRRRRAVVRPGCSGAMPSRMPSPDSSSPW